MPDATWYKRRRDQVGRDKLAQYAYEHFKLVYNNEGNNMEQNIETLNTVKFTDEELAALLAKPIAITSDELEETDEDKVTLN